MSSCSGHLLTKIVIMCNNKSMDWKSHIIKWGFGCKHNCIANKIILL